MQYPKKRGFERKMFCSNFFLNKKEPKLNFFCLKFTHNYAFVFAYEFKTSSALKIITFFKNFSDFLNFCIKNDGFMNS